MSSAILSVKISRWCLALGLFCTGLGGGFAPWIWRESVALQLTAPGLAEFVKFLPEVRLGQLQIERLYFLLPLFLAIVGLPLIVENQKLDLPAWLRWSLRLAVLPLALSALSPVWTPAILMSTEFRLQTFLALAAIGLTVIGPLFRRVPLKLLVIVLAGVGIAAAILPWRQFALIQSSISEAYHEPVNLGWGWWLTLSGILLSIMGGVWAAFFAGPENSGASH